MTMKRFLGGVASATLLFAAGALVAPPAMAEERPRSVAEVDPDFEFYPLPPGKGAEDTYFACVACHSLRTVTNTGFSRRVWDELLDWMVEDQGMMELDPEEREIILDYLSTYIGEDWEG